MPADCSLSVLGIFVVARFRYLVTQPNGVSTSFFSSPPFLFIHPFPFSSKHIVLFAYPLLSHHPLSFLVPTSRFVIPHEILNGEFH